MTTIRRLAPAHAATYRALMLECYALHPDAFTSSEAERRALPIGWWQSRLNEADDAAEVVFGAFDASGALAGVCGISFEPREKARHKALLFGMYVAAHCRQSGIGRQLVDAAMQFARRRPGVRLVQLSVTGGNTAAQSLYERCGFVAFGLEPYAVAVGDGFVDKLHMWCNLDLP